jgi:hypothetical protein
MNDGGFREDAREAEDAISQLPVGNETAEPPAWEMIDAGRYMPRRIRGSYRGRVLG